MARKTPAWKVLLVALALVAAGVAVRAEDAPETPALGGGGRRVALVVGNADYRSVERLANPGNDARMMADMLKALGFTLIGDGAQLNLDKPGLDGAILKFGRALPGAEVALFYYSGHGLQVQGVNWLVPVDANPTRPQDMDFQMVDADIVLRQMDGAGAKLNILILDACRNNPFPVRGLRAMSGGLAEMRAPEGTLISYATQPGNVARDGGGPNSPYTTALVRAMQQPGLDIFRTFNQVGLQVKRATGGEQQPWVSNSPIDGDFTFAPPTAVPAAMAGLAPPRLPPALSDAPPHPEQERQALARALPCSLPEERSASRGVRIVGQPATGPQLDGLIDRATAGRTGSQDIERLPAFACEPIGVVGELIRRNREAGRTLSIVTRRRELVVGERLDISASGGAGATYVDLFSADGTVRHLQAPGMAGSASRPPIGSEGLSLVVVLTAPAPLALTARPVTERADSYLADLRKALQHAATLPGSERIRADATALTIRRGATPAAATAAITAARQPAPRTPGKPALCGDMLQRFQLGEPLSVRERTLLSAECGL